MAMAAVACEKRLFPTRSMWTPVCAAGALLVLGVCVTSGAVAGAGPWMQSAEQLQKLKIAVVGSSHAEHVGLALVAALPSAQFEIRPFVTDAATIWKNVSWCGGIHYSMWRFLPLVHAFAPQVVLLSTGASDSRRCFWDQSPEPALRTGPSIKLGAHYGANMHELALWLTSRGYYVLLVTPPTFLRGKTQFGDCDSAERLFGHNDPFHVFNRSRIETDIVPAQRFVAEHMWNVGLYDLQAITKRLQQPAIYHDCAHLKPSPLAYAVYDRLVVMLRSLRTDVFSKEAAPLCLSRRCREHNVAVSAPGAVPAEDFQFAGALLAALTSPPDSAAGSGSAASELAEVALLPHGGESEADGRRRRR